MEHSPGRWERSAVLGARLQGCYAPGRTLAVDDDVGERRGGTGSAQHMRRVHAVAFQLRQDLVAQRVAANFGDQRRREAQARCGRQRVGAVAAALRLWEAGAACQATDGMLPDVLKK